jgi:K+-transporting ATPase ATPase A chain
MTLRDFVQLAILIAALALLTKPCGLYLEAVFEGGDHPLKRALGGLESLIYRIARIDSSQLQSQEQEWTAYGLDLLAFCFVSVVFNYAILRLQHRLPLNPQALGPLSPHLAFNAAIGFITGTAWTSYTSESAISYSSQMVGLTYQNFASAATGICAAVVVIRGLARKESPTVGNFWVDLVRASLYVLFPASLLFALFLVSQGVVQNFSAYRWVTTLEGGRQLIAQGPAASQVAIKILGSNGEGFFAANAAHPYENPTALCNCLQMLGMLVIPSGLVYYLGTAAKNLRHAWSVWIAMTLLLVAGTWVCAHFEREGNPVYQRLGATSPANWEGKEARFGIFGSALFSTISTDTSTGATNAALDSFTPLGGLVPLVDMKLGEVVFGGVGAGLYGIVSVILLTVFIAGLMVGRTPEYLGKKVEGREIKYVMLATIAFPLLVLLFTAWASLDHRSLASLGNPGAHGFTEILYAYTSGAANNGSSFGGLSTNTPFWDLTLAFVMFFGRFLTMIPMLAVAGSMASKRAHPVSNGTFPAEGAVFISLLVGVIVIVGALTFFPALVLGPVSEHFMMRQLNF